MASAWIADGVTNPRSATARSRGAGRPRSENTGPVGAVCSATAGEVSVEWSRACEGATTSAVMKG